MNNFPWPIITDNPATSDYEGLISSLHKEMTIEASSEGISFRWNPATSSDFINQMLAQGQACWIIEFNCPKTLLMHRLKLPINTELSKLLSFNEVRGDVYINVYIQCAAQIDAFKPAGIPPELAALDFSLRAGDIIGSARMKVFADPEYLMAPGMKSIFKIRPAGPTDGNASYRCNNDGDYFTIVLNKTLYNQFERARMSAKSAGKKAASGLIVLTPLTLLIKDLIGVDPTKADLTTAQRRLLTLLESCGIPALTSNIQPIEAAMQLLEKNKVLPTCFERMS